MRSRPGRPSRRVLPESNRGGEREKAKSITIRTSPDKSGLEGPALPRGGASRRADVPGSAESVPGCPGYTGPDVVGRGFLPARRGRGLEKRWERTRRLSPPGSRSPESLPMLEWAARKGSCEGALVSVGTPFTGRVSRVSRTASGRFVCSVLADEGPRDEGRGRARGPGAGARANEGRAPRTQS